MQEGHWGILLARDLEREDAAPQEERANRVGAHHAWVEENNLLDLVGVEGGDWLLSESCRLRVVGCHRRVRSQGAVQFGSCMGGFILVVQPTKAYAMTTSATDMRKLAISIMTNWNITRGGCPRLWCSSVNGKDGMGAPSPVSGTILSLNRAGSQPCQADSVSQHRIPGGGSDLTTACAPACTTRKAAC